MTPAPISDFGVVERHPDGTVSITEPNHLWLVNALARAFRPEPIEPTLAALPASKPTRRKLAGSKLWSDTDAA